MTTITRFQAENFKRLKLVEIRPDADGNIVAITGRNEQGKSSVLDGIMAALGGKNYTPSRPVRMGEDEGAVKLELSNGLVVTRTFNADGTGGKVIVENGEGMRASSPQAVLDKLYSSVAFDPIEFTRLDPKVQLDRLRSLVKLDVDVDELTKLNAADYDERRDVNRDLKTAETTLAQMPTYAGLPAQPIDEAAMELTIASAAEVNSGIERRKLNREQFVEALEGNREQLATIIAGIATLTNEKTKYERVIAEQEEKIASAAPLPEPIDVSDAQTQLREARETNQKLAAMQRADAQKLLVDSLSGKATMLTKRMDDRKAAIAKAFETAKMPVPGLSFGEGEVLLDGLPLSQASSARRLRTSTAIGLAMAPELKVMLVRDASLLDAEGYQLLTQMAVDAGAQFWVESVDRGDAVGIIMEDGEVQGAIEPTPIEKGKRRTRKPDAEAQAAVEAAVEAGANVMRVVTGEIDTATGEVTIDSDTAIGDEEPPFVPDPPKPAPKAGLFDYD